MIIKSLLDTDLYKITVWQAFLHHHPDAYARSELICRNPKIFSLSKVITRIEEEIENLTTLKFTEDELSYLSNIPYLKIDFINFLRIFHLQKEFIKIKKSGNGITLVIEGPQVHTTIFEIYILSIISEIYSQQVASGSELELGRKNLNNKISLIKQVVQEDRESCCPFQFFDFGTRRRFSQQWQSEIVKTLKQEVPDYFKGTSSLLLAKQYQLTPIGTHSHEYFQSHQAYGVQLRNFQKKALEEWVQEYRGDLGIALTDTIGIDAFLRDFDLYFAKLFDGLRHDSGDPFEWANKCIAHYKKLNIDPKTKRLVFSNSLDIPTALKIYKAFNKKIKLGFGIGTNLTNDVGITPLNIVIKNTSCNQQPTAKITDDPNKTISVDESYLTYLKSIFAGSAPK